MKTKRLTFLAIMLAISIVLSYVESFIPLPVPGVKLGLANVITLIVMYIYGEKDAFLILILRIFFVGIFRGTIATPTFFLSLSGGMTAFLLMFSFKKLKVFSIVGISVMGAFGHSVGQILMAMFLLNSPEIAYWLPFIVGISIVTGVITGLIANRFVEIIKKAYI
ncbi:Gx transporter family protein [Candidatus Izimaplasma bacterium]|nr:Gx transporter family protein [Candidatus Izimaplasma bacterium]